MDKKKIFLVLFLVLIIGIVIFLIIHFRKKNTTSTGTTPSSSTNVSLNMNLNNNTTTLSLNSSILSGYTVEQFINYIASNTSVLPSNYSWNSITINSTAVPLDNGQISNTVSSQNLYTFLGISSIQNLSFSATFTCLPSCANNTCGSDGCGGNCTCSQSYICQNGSCISAPQCPQNSYPNVDVCKGQTGICGQTGWQILNNFCPSGNSLYNCCKNSQIGPIATCNTDSNGNTNVSCQNCPDTSCPSLFCNLGTGSCTATGWVCQNGVLPCPADISKYKSCCPDSENPIPTCTGSGGINKIICGKCPNDSTACSEPCLGNCCPVNTVCLNLNNVCSCLSTDNLGYLLTNNFFSIYDMTTTSFFNGYLTDSIQSIGITKDIQYATHWKIILLNSTDFYIMRDDGQYWGLDSKYETSSISITGSPIIFNMYKNDGSLVNLLTTPADESIQEYKTPGGNVFKAKGTGYYNIVYKDKNSKVGIYTWNWVLNYDNPNTPALMSFIPTS